MAVEQGESFRRAAKMLSVPRSTLHDHCIQLDSKTSPKPYLNKEEDEPHKVP